MKPDPRIRRDGRCIVCRKSRRRTVPQASALRGDARRLLEEMLADDPFCSAPCARAYHGVDDVEITSLERAQTRRALAELEHDEAAA